MGRGWKGGLSCFTPFCFPWGSDATTRCVAAADTGPRAGSDDVKGGRCDWRLAARSGLRLAEWIFPQRGVEDGSAFVSWVVSRFFGWYVVNCQMTQRGGAGNNAGMHVDC